MVVGVERNHHPQFGKHSSQYSDIGTQLRDPTTSMKPGVQGMDGEGLQRDQDNQRSIDECANELMSTYIELQSLLCSLTVEYIRRDFLEGKIVELEDVELVLFSLDRMRELLMPNWCASAKARNVTAAVVVEHMKALAAGEEQTFNIPSRLVVLERSYGEWKEVLQQLVSSKYWQNMDSREMTLRLVSKEGDCKVASVDERAGRTKKSGGRQCQSRGNRISRQ